MTMTEHPDMTVDQQLAELGIRIESTDDGRLTIALTDDWTPEQHAQIVSDVIDAAMAKVDEIQGRRRHDWAPQPCPSWCEHSALHDDGPREHCAGFPEVGDCDLLVGVIEHEDGTLTDLDVNEGDFEIPTPGLSPQDQVEWLNRRIRTYARALSVVEGILATGRLVYPYTWPQDEV